MPKKDDLGFQAASRPERRDQHVKKQAEEQDHLGLAYPNSTPRTVWIGFSVGTGHFSVPILDLEPEGYLRPATPRTRLPAPIQAE
jgi:hypothetical protein